MHWERRGKGAGKRRVTTARRDGGRRKELPIPWVGQRVDGEQVSARRGCREPPMRYLALGKPDSARLCAIQGFNLNYRYVFSPEGWWTLLLQ
jgi:hypothetical protein